MSVTNYHTPDSYNTTRAIMQSLSSNIKIAEHISDTSSAESLKSDRVSEGGNTFLSSLRILSLRAAADSAALSAASMKLLYCQLKLRLI